MASAAAIAGALLPQAGAEAADGSPASTSTVPFHGVHQAGIASGEQARLVFATYDVTASDRGGLTALLTAWTDAAERLTAGASIDGPAGPAAPPPDTGEAVGLGPARLTLTVGFGPTLFDDRFGLRSRRPAALVDLPTFAGEALDPLQTGGDLCVQACADDAQVAFHAVHNLTRLGLGSVTLRSLQAGFGRTASAGVGSPTPRNLLGFKDGTNNLDPSDAALMDREVWVPDRSDQPWMVGGSYLVARRIRVHLEAWNASTLDEQQQAIGRAKESGAPLGGSRESDPLDLSAMSSTGVPVIPLHAHVRVAASSTNHGAAILRRGYSFVDGVDPASGEIDAGLFFICFQQDPRRQFVPIQQRLADQDTFAQYLLTTGSGIFACPPGPLPGRPWGGGLL